MAYNYLINGKEAPSGTRCWVVNENGSYASGFISYVIPTPNVITVTLDGAVGSGVFTFNEEDICLNEEERDNKSIINIVMNS